MPLTLELKYYTALIFVHLINDTMSVLTFAGKGHNLRTQKVSNAQKNVALHWPKGIVAYYFDNGTYDDYIAQKVRMAINVLETASCVKFKPTLVKPDGNMTWIHFTNPQGDRNCVHEPKFKDDGEIILVLGFDCLKQHEILHTLLHAIGFNDEVSHPQRDQYIRVMWNNIQPEYRYLYSIRPSEEKFSQPLVEYDPLSIMHFHDRAFSLNGQATVMPLVPGLLISPSDDLSQLDKMRLRLLFDHECNKRKVGDVMDTCKMLLSTDGGPNDSESTTNSQSKEEYKKPAKKNETEKVIKVDGEEEVESDNEVDQSSKIHGSIDISISIGPGDTENAADEPDEKGGDSVENQNDSNAQKSDDKVNKIIKLEFPDRYGFGLG